MTTLYVEPPLAAQGLLNMFASLAGLVGELGDESRSTDTHYFLISFSEYLVRVINEYPLK